jgi:peptidoglycan/LPS O-acetylase OafA/YrhL
MPVESIGDGKRVLALTAEAKACSPTRIPELDGLRGIAIGMVVIFHYFYMIVVAAPYSPLYFARIPFRLTWTGVDLFFVLSGFLIGGILIDARDSENYFRVFYRRRFCRIVPIYGVVLAISLGLLGLINKGVLAPRFSWMAANQLSWIPYLAFLQNFWMMQYNTLGAPILGVTWSLAVEEQFYVTFPWIVRAASKRGLLIFTLCGIILAPILRTALYVYWKPHPSWFVMMPCRADALLLGVLGAWLVRSVDGRTWLFEKRKLAIWALIVLVLGVGALLKMSPGMYDFWMVSVGYTWMAVFYLSILLYAVIWPDSVIGRCLRLRWLRWLGTIAYGTYLLHGLIVCLLFTAFRAKYPVVQSWWDVMVVIVSLTLTLAIARASWLYFEKPFVRLGHGTEYEFSRVISKCDISEALLGRVNRNW